MSSSLRTHLAPGYLLHQVPYRETGRILDVWTREHGRLSLFARGVRGPKAKLAPVLQSFRLLLLSWSGRGEAPLLIGAEVAASVGAAVPAPALMACFYLNELLLRLTSRHDPHPALFDVYHATLECVKSGGALEPTLRIFEKHLLGEVGYGLDLDADSSTGRRVAAGEFYQYRPAQGLVVASPQTPGAIAGQAVLSLAAERFESAVELEDARRLLRSALEHCLEGRELKTRAVARSLELLASARVAARVAPERIASGLAPSEPVAAERGR
ncbi:MAG: DNA repair protein RecO [Steroidobacteraceae bacterium]